MAEPEDRRAEVNAASERKPCVICGKLRDPHYDPFCSKRCADIDLHRWLSAAYVVPGGAANEPRGDEDE